MTQTPEPNAPNESKPLLTPDQNRPPPPLPAPGGDNDDDALSDTAIPALPPQNDGS